MTILKASNKYLASVSMHVRKKLWNLVMQITGFTDQQKQFKKQVITSNEQSINVKTKKYLQFDYLPGFLTCPKNELFTDHSNNKKRLKNS